MTNSRTRALTKPIVTRRSRSRAQLDLSRPGDGGRRGSGGPGGGCTGALLPLDTGFEKLKLTTLGPELQIHVVLRGPVECVFEFLDCTLSEQLRTIKQFLYKTTFSVDTPSTLLT